MRVSLKTRGLRWVVPGGVAATIALAAFLASTVASASAEPNLPPRTAAQLLVALEQARPAGLSGTIVETAKLGLPALPDIGGSGGDASLSLPNLVTGAHTLRVWYAGQQDQRLALLGQLSESDVIHHGTDLWTYTSTNRRVTHTALPKNQADVTPRLGTLTPQQAAEDALKAIDPTTSVDVDRTARVAGRAAYQLVLSPKDARSLIGSVRIAIDADTSVPLRVQVFAKGASSPAIQVGFTDISFKVPDPSVFHFVPPAGSTVVQGNPLTDAGPAVGSGPGAPLRHRTVEKAPAGQMVEPPATGSKTEVPGTDSSRAKVLGSGWTAVLEINTGASLDQANSQFGDLLNKAATPVNGGRLLTSALFSVFIADDGRIFVGPVTGTAIQQVAATGHGL